MSSRFKLLLSGVHSAYNGKKEPGRPAAHQDSRKRFNASDQPPFPGQHQVAIPRGRVSDGAK